MTSRDTFLTIVFVLFNTTYIYFIIIILQAIININILVNMVKNRLLISIVYKNYNKKYSYNKIKL